MTSPSENFFVKGFTPDAYATLSKYRVALCPLRFGAGIKGKICDSFLSGTPVVTNQMGAEGMVYETKKTIDGKNSQADLENVPSDKIFGGKISQSETEFIEDCVLLYNNQNEWKKAQEKGFLQINAQFSEKEQASKVWSRILDTFQNLQEAREQNYMGEILVHGKNQWTSSFSSFLETKHRLNLLQNQRPSAINSFGIVFTEEIVNSEIDKYRDAKNRFIRHPLNWNQIEDILKKGTIGSFGRNKEYVQKYIEARQAAKQNYVSLADPILERDFNCPTELVEGKKRAIRPTSLRPFYVLTPNRYRKITFSLYFPGSII